MTSAQPVALAPVSLPMMVRPAKKHSEIRHRHERRKMQRQRLVGAEVVHGEAEMQHGADAQAARARRERAIAVMQASARLLEKLSSAVGTNAKSAPARRTSATRSEAGLSFASPFVRGVPDPEN
jgi:multidrug resistance efflux pump